MRYLLLTGMSGAGKTLALRDLEDFGALCVDNLPPSMIAPLVSSCESAPLERELVAFSVDVRSGSFFDAVAVSRLLREIRTLGQRVETVFLEASDETLLSRFKESRREHPLSGAHVTLTDAIARERSLLQPLREGADHLIDTTNLKPKTLKSRLQSIQGEKEDGTAAGVRLEVMSFGFKRGLPRQADLVFDVRFLPNPFYIPELGRHTGLDEDVRTFVLEHPTTQEFLDKLHDLMRFLIPRYREEGKRRLVIAVGCTGGAHRSVAIAEDLSAWLRTEGYPVETGHRDLTLEVASWETRGTLTDEEGMD